MSNLLKSGFQSLGSQASKPFIVDYSNKQIGETKVIRSIEENQEKSEEQDLHGANEAVLSDALDKAKLLRDDAVLKASQIISDAKNEAESIRQQAYEEGYNQGLSDGNMEAMRRGDEYLAGIQRQQDEIIAKEKEQLDAALAESKTKLVDFNCKIIEKITGILLDEYKPVMLHMINDALRDAETSKYYIIKVSEGNYAYVSDNSERLAGASNPGISIDVYGDAGLRDDQCIIETENGLIDLSLDVQIKNLVLAIKMLSD